MMDIGTHAPHESHTHVHGAACGHAPVPHADHTDHLHDGHIHHAHAGHYDEALLLTTDIHLPHPGHDHSHGPSCGHEAVTHGDHADYVHDGHRHASHGDHVDEH